MLEYAGWGLVLLWGLWLWPVWYGLLWPRKLVDVAPISPDAPDPPLVSVIVPARDEAPAAERCLRRLLALDYPHYEVIAVDDRSTDGTGEIMERVAASDARCRVIHISELPSGWVAKNHANLAGVRQARGEYLLFTDGDVEFEPAVLRHAVAAMLAGDLDHLAVMPLVPCRGFFEAAMLCWFATHFIAMTRMPLVRFRRFRRAFVGIGAFNMIRRSAYDAIGTHERLRLEVGDDLMLGKLIKDAGLRQDARGGAPLVRVRWQNGVGGIIRGLEKNAFAGARYSILAAAMSVIIQLLASLAPPVIWIAGPWRWPAGAFVVMTVLTMMGIARQGRYPLLTAACYPVAGVLLGFTMLRSTWITLRTGGVTWRDTFYPLAELRAGMIESRPLP